MRWNWIIYNMTLMSSQFHYILHFWKTVIVYNLYNNSFNEPVSMKQTVYLKKKKTDQGWWGSWEEEKTKCLYHQEKPSA